MLSLFMCGRLRASCSRSAGRGCASLPLGAVPARSAPIYGMDGAGRRDGGGACSLRCASPLVNAQIVYSAPRGHTKNTLTRTTTLR